MTKTKLQKLEQKLDMLEYELVHVHLQESKDAIRKLRNEVKNELRRLLSE